MAKERDYRLVLVHVEGKILKQVSPVKQITLEQDGGLAFVIEDELGASLRVPAEHIQLPEEPNDDPQGLP